jgi:hypothetical protein
MPTDLFVVIPLPFFKLNYTPRLLLVGLPPWYWFLFRVRNYFLFHLYFLILFFSVTAIILKLHRVEFDLSYIVADMVFGQNSIFSQRSLRLTSSSVTYNQSCGSAWFSLRIRIERFTSMRIRIQGVKPMRIRNRILVRL